MPGFKISSLFTSFMLLFCMLVNVQGYTSNERQVWYPGKVGGMYRNCKIRAITEFKKVKKDSCSGLSGSDYKDCKYLMKKLKKQLKTACVTAKNKYQMYIARNTPIDIIGSILTDNDIATDNYNGRIPIDGEDLYKINYEGQTLEYYRSGYKYKAVDTYTVEFNGATYKQVGFHFHKPSEHTYDGEYSSMEVHFVHVLADAPQFGQLQDVDKYLVLGFMIQDFATSLTDCGGGTPYETLFDDAINQESTFELIITPAMVSRIYSYEGGLTTLPYTTRVRWTLSPYWMNSNAIGNWPNPQQQLPTDLYPLSTWVGYPDRPPLRALNNDVFVMERDTSAGYYYNGCPA
jgi:carbonic anhydrase